MAIVINACAYRPVAAASFLTSSGTVVHDGNRWPIVAMITEQARHRAAVVRRDRGDERVPQVTGNSSGTATLE